MLKTQGPSLNQSTPNRQNTIESSDDDLPMETQQAQCTISAGEVQASAQATISRKLEGVCSSSNTARIYL